MDDIPADSESGVAPSYPAENDNLRMEFDGSQRRTMGAFDPTPPAVLTVDAI